MDTAHLKAFLRIAETGSISRAAQSLGIAQPSLSQQLLRLEDEIGFKLFERIARGVILTEVGRVFLERARHILHVTEQAIADARHLRDEAQGQVVFAMPPSIARLAGAALVEALAAEAPLVRVRVVEAFTGSIRGWLEAEKIDLGILYDHGSLRHISGRFLLCDQLVLTGPTGHFSAGHQAMLGDLAGEALIAPGPQHGLRQLIEREAGRAGIELRIDQEIDSLDVMIELVAAGHGLAVLPLCGVSSQIRAGRLTAAKIGSPPLQRTLNIVRNPAHVLTHASVIVERVLGQIVDRYGAEPGEMETP
ncbi:MAG: LysR family transcriptional regulator [Sphingomonadales bacterium]|nr:LysR family transcriptional regulator [Sphingomonadales bacterium]